MAINEAISKSSAGRLRPSSSIAGDVWHDETPDTAYEWWYFDALSDDGRDALVIIFLSNFIFSPRYNRMATASLRQSKQAHNSPRHPAVAICFYRDGHPLFRAINEYAAGEFSASPTQPEAHIGPNTFRLVETSAGPRYELSISTKLRRNRILQAQLIWTMTDGNFFDEENDVGPDAALHHWNMVAPRCDVSGEIKVSERSGERFFESQYRGTGYHDHNRDGRWMPQTIAEWQWGRIHFPRSTAVFYRYRERDKTEHTTRLYLVQDGSLTACSPQFSEDRRRRHLFGLRYPRLLRLQGNAGGALPTLSVRQERVVDGSFFYLRFLSEATLETTDGRVQHATGISEHLAPRSLSFPWLQWLIDMRIGRNGRGAFLP